MYTTRSVKRFTQSVALCVVVVLSAFPAVTLACQWACAPQVAGHTHHQKGQPETAIHAAHDAAPSTERGLVSAELPCPHASITVSATSMLPVKVFAPIAVPAVVALLAPPIDRTAIFVTVAIPSPPRARSAPIALRI